MALTGLGRGHDAPSRESFSRRAVSTLAMAFSLSRCLPRRARFRVEGFRPAAFATSCWSSPSSRMRGGKIMGRLLVPPASLPGESTHRVYDLQLLKSVYLFMRLVKSLAGQTKRANALGEARQHLRPRRTSGGHMQICVALAQRISVKRCHIYLSSWASSTLLAARTSSGLIMPIQLQPQHSTSAGNSILLQVRHLRQVEGGGDCGNNTPSRHSPSR